MQRLPRLCFVLALSILAVGPARAARQMENLTRGVVAVKQEGGKMYVGWRLFGTDPEGIAFNLYRQETGGAAVKVNATPIATSTNHVDQGLDAAKSYSYFVRPIVDGKELAASKPAVAWDREYLEFPIKPIANYRPGDASVADLDGDGVYEVIVHQASNPKDNSFNGLTGEPIFDAYKLDGTHLWRINLGKNIRDGEHYTQFMVYDLDGDGKAEFFAKTADGTIDGTGKVIGDATKDHRIKTNDADRQHGRILSGPEYFTVFNGETGAAMDTVDYIPGRDPIDGWGGVGGNAGNDSYGNRVDRFLAAVAYLDGVRPSVVYIRGVYGRTVMAAWDWDGRKLKSRWVFDSGISMPPYKDASPFSGQGGHNLSVGDVDGDGKDDIIYCSMTVGSDGKGLYSAGYRHGDSMVATDHDPNRPGLEVFTIHENENHTVEWGHPGASMHDARTGEILWKDLPGVDIGSGMSADIDPRHRGLETWFGQQYGLRDVKGNHIGGTKEKPGPSPRGAGWVTWWDGDLLRELNGRGISKWDWEKGTETPLYTLPGRSGGRGPMQADLLGDWREEMIVLGPNGDTMRLVTTTIPTEHRIYTLMHDPMYRLAVAWQNVVYNKPPQVGFYLGDGMAPPPKPNIYLIGGGEAIAGVRK
jgi:rhamnogalacturonan endolyase